MGTLLISNSLLSTTDIKKFLVGPGKVRLSPDAENLISNSHKNLMSLIDRGEKIYGVNTGFGLLSQVSIPKDAQKKLQLNLVRSHAAGVGKPFDYGIVRVTMILKLVTFAKGYSGIRPEVADQLVQFINHDILPIVPRQGSVGASGDLAPLAHIALSMIGEGNVHFQERIMPAIVAIKEAGLKPLVLEAKEGLSLINGTHVSTALGLKALVEAETLLKTADIVGAMSVEGSLSSRNIFAAKIHRLKKHKGQQESAKNIWNFLKDSEIIASHENCEKIQDPYSIRCIPHVHGTSREIFRAMKSMIENEANSVSDNPLIFSDKEVRSTGHFHAEAVAQALDSLSIAMSEIGAISERRIHYFMKGIGDKVPLFAANNPGLESGFMIAQVTAAALASENKTLSHPASVDSIPTSAGQEDMVSMAPWAGRKCLRIIRNVTQILAIELYVASKVIAKFHGELNPSPCSKIILRLIKNKINLSEGDHSLYEDMATLNDLIQRGSILSTVSKNLKLE